MKPGKYFWAAMKRALTAAGSFQSQYKALRQRYAGTRFEEQRQLHLPQKHKATVPESSLCVEMNALEEQADNAQARALYWKPLSWFGTIRPTSANDAFDPALWTTFVSTTLGVEVPVFSSLPRLHISPLAECGCKNTPWSCTATKSPRVQFRTAGHIVRTQHGVTASAGQRRGDVEIRSFPQDAAGRRSLVFDLSMTHDRFGSSSHVQQNGLLLHPQDLDAPLGLAAQRKINSYRQKYADNQNISFLPAIVSTSTLSASEAGTAENFFGLFAMLFEDVAKEDDVFMASLTLVLVLLLGFDRRCARHGARVSVL
jgi:hypothetical protein